MAFFAVFLTISNHHLIQNFHNLYLKHPSCFPLSALS